jgi:hypothetical protein
MFNIVEISSEFEPASKWSFCMRGTNMKAEV